MSRMLDVYCSLVLQRPVHDVEFSTMDKVAFTDDIMKKVREAGHSLESKYTAATKGNFLGRAGDSINRAREAAVDRTSRIFGRLGGIGSDGMTSAQRGSVASRNGLASSVVGHNNAEKIRGTAASTTRRDVEKRRDKAYANIGRMLRQGTSVHVGLPPGAFEPANHASTMKQLDRRKYTVDATNAYSGLGNEQYLKNRDSFNRAQAAMKKGKYSPEGRALDAEVRSRGAASKAKIEARNKQREDTKKVLLRGVYPQREVKPKEPGVPWGQVPPDDKATAAQKKELRKKYIFAVDGFLPKSKPPALSIEERHKRNALAASDRGASKHMARLRNTYDVSDRRTYPPTTEGETEHRLGTMSRAMHEAKTPADRQARASEYLEARRGVDAGSRNQVTGKSTRDIGAEIGRRESLARTSGNADELMGWFSGTKPSSIPLDSRRRLLRAQHTVPIQQRAQPQHGVYRMLENNWR